MPPLIIENILIGSMVDTTTSPLEKITPDPLTNTAPYLLANKMHDSLADTTSDVLANETLDLLIDTAADPVADITPALLVDITPKTKKFDFLALSKCQIFEYLHVLNRFWMWPDHLLRIISNQRKRIKRLKIKVSEDLIATENHGDVASAALMVNMY